MDRPVQQVDYFPHAFACDCGSPQLVQRSGRGQVVKCHACNQEHGPFDLAPSRLERPVCASQEDAPATESSTEICTDASEVFLFEEHTGAQLVDRLVAIRDAGESWSDSTLLELKELIEELEQRKCQEEGVRRSPWMTFTESPRHLPGMAVLAQATLDIMDRLYKPQPYSASLTLVEHVHEQVEVFADYMSFWWTDDVSQQHIIRSLQRYPTERKIDWLHRIIRNGRESIENENLTHFLELLAAEPTLPEAVRNRARQATQPAPVPVPLDRAKVRWEGLKFCLIGACGIVAVFGSVIGLLALMNVIIPDPPVAAKTVALLCFLFCVPFGKLFTNGLTQLIFGDYRRVGG